MKSAILAFFFFLFIQSITGQTTTTTTSANPPVASPTPPTPTQPQTPPAPKKTLNISPGCKAAREGLKNTPFSSTMRFVMRANSSFDQFSQNVTNSLNAVCNDQVRRQTQEALDNVKKSCTAGDDQLVVRRTANKLFKIDIACMKSSDGNLCATRFLAATKDTTGAKYRDFQKLLSGRPSNITLEQLPKDVVCGDCVKRIAEQKFAMRRQLSQIPPAVPADRLAKQQQRYQESINKINAICGANFLNANPQVEGGLGTPRRRR